jgi:hypothetical protein
VVASALGVPKAAVKVVRGHASRHKQIEVEGVPEREVRRLLGTPEEPLFWALRPSLFALTLHRGVRYHRTHATRRRIITAIGYDGDE